MGRERNVRGAAARAPVEGLNHFSRLAPEVTARLANADMAGEQLADSGTVGHGESPPGDAWPAVQW